MNPNSITAKTNQCLQDRQVRYTPIRASSKNRKDVAAICVYGTLTPDSPTTVILENDNALLAPSENIKY